MTYWGDRYRNHALWAEVSGAREQLNGVEVAPDDPRSNELLAYVGQVIELLERRNEETDALEVSPGALDGTSSVVSQLGAGLQNVNAEVWTMEDVVPAADSVMNALASWPPLKPARYLSGIQAATDSFASKVQETLDSVSAGSEDTKTRLSELATAESELQSQIDEQKARIAEAVAEFKTESKTEIDELVEAKDAEIAEYVRSWTEKNRSHEAEAVQLITRLKEHEQTARSTVHATTALVVATDYGKYARNKNFAAWTCDVAAALVGAAGVTAILVHLYTLDGVADSDMGVSMTRLAASLGTLGIAALLGRRGAQHHREARAAKRTDLALRRVGPFIVDLPRDEQQEIVLDFTERVFIRGDLDGSGAPSDEKTLRERIQRLRAARRSEPTSE